MSYRFYAKGHTGGLIFLDGNILPGMILGMLAGLTISSPFAARKGRQPG